MQTQFLNSSTPPTELNIQKLGMTHRGIEDTHSPRKEYQLNENSRKLLSTFFNIPLSNRIKTIWLTPATIEDLLIFHAFTMENFKMVFVIPTDEHRTLYGSNEDDAIISAVKASIESYINPKLFIQTH